MYFIEKFPWILDLNLFSENSSSMQNLSIDSSTISSESADQSYLENFLKESSIANLLRILAAFFMKYLHQKIRT